MSAQSNAAVDEILRRLVTQGKGFVDTSGRDSICNVSYIFFEIHKLSLPIPLKSPFA